MASVKGLKLMSYEFPGDESQSWTVEPQRMSELLGRERIVIPVFQRSYCWSDEQIAGWWRDLLTAQEEAGIAPGHRVGRLMFKRSDGDGALLCIDGQQRLTTALLLLAAVRDAALRLSNDSDSDSDGAALAARLNGVLFADTDQAQQQGQTAVATGQLLPFCRLWPSYVDRAPFFELLLMQSPSAETQRSVQYRAKRYFDERIEQWLAGRAVPARSLGHLARRQLDFFTLMYMECHSAVALPQLFLWLQEKALFSMGTLLFNPSPGVLFRAGDMVRNWLLALFADADAAQLERLYVDKWVRPFESRFTCYGHMDAFFCRYVDAAACSHVGPFEQQLIDMAPMIKAHKMRLDPGSGVALFARYHSVFDYHAQHTAPLGPELATFMLDDLARFAAVVPPMVADASTN